MNSIVLPYDADLLVLGGSDYFEVWLADYLENEFMKTCLPCLNHHKICIIYVAISIVNFDSATTFAPATIITRMSSRVANLSMLGRHNALH